MRTKKRLLLTNPLNMVVEKMYIRTTCTQCGNVDCHDVDVHVSETRTGPSIKHIEVTDSVSEEELARDVIRGLRPYVHNGIDVREICCIVKKYYGIVAAYCCDLVTRLKIELGMYCPDRRHLYFVVP